MCTTRYCWGKACYYALISVCNLLGELETVSLAFRSSAVFLYAYFMSASREAKGSHNDAIQRDEYLWYDGDAIHS